MRKHPGVNMLNLKQEHKARQSRCYYLIYVQNSFKQPKWMEITEGAAEGKMTRHDIKPINKSSAFIKNSSTRKNVYRTQNVGGAGGS